MQKEKTPRYETAPDGRKLKTLALIIKQKYFDMILSGRKVREYREVRPTTIGRLLQQVPDPEDPSKKIEVEDEYGNAQPIKYDAIRFYVGYASDRDTALVEVQNAYCEIFVDDDEKPIEYEYGGQLWVAEQVVYELGAILSKQTKPKRTR